MHIIVNVSQKLDVCIVVYTTIVPIVVEDKDIPDLLSIGVIFIVDMLICKLALESLF